MCSHATIGKNMPVHSTPMWAPGVARSPIAVAATAAASDASSNGTCAQPGACADTVGPSIWRVTSAGAPVDGTSSRVNAK